MGHDPTEVERLARNLGLGSLLADLRTSHGGYELLDHWQQGEFHHDVLLRLPEAHRLPGRYLVVATNCNGGVKEVLCFAAAPTHGALWRARCPDNPEFAGELPPLVAEARTVHWFDPCDLLRPDARSEYRPEHAGVLGLCPTHRPAHPGRLHPLTPHLRAPRPSAAAALRRWSSSWTVRTVAKGAFRSRRCLRARASRSRGSLRA